MILPSSVFVNIAQFSFFISLFFVQNEYIYAQRSNFNMIFCLVVQTVQLIYSISLINILISTSWFSFCLYFAISEHILIIGLFFICFSLYLMLIQNTFSLFDVLFNCTQLTFMIYFKLKKDLWRIQLLISLYYSFEPS